VSSSLRRAMSYRAPLTRVPPAPLGAGRGTPAAISEPRSRTLSSLPEQCLRRQRTLTILDRLNELLSRFRQVATLLGALLSTVEKGTISHGREVTRAGLAIGGS